MPIIRRSMYHVWSILAKHLAPATAGQLIIGQGANTNPAWVTIGGDATLAADGTLTIAAGSTGPADIGTVGKAATNIAQDDLVCITAVTASGVPVFSIADADVAAKQATYVATAALASGATSSTPIFRLNVLSAATLNTNAGNVGDPVYLTTTGTTGNTWSLTAPSAAGSIVQVVGRINVKSATVGQIAWELVGQPQITIGSNELQALSVTEAKVATNSLSALVAANVTVPSATPGGAAQPLTAVNMGMPVVLVLDVLDAASGNADFTSVPYKFTVTEVLYIKSGAGNAGNSITVDNGTGGAHITNAMNSATDGGTATASTLGNTTIAANATIRCVTVRAGNTNGARIVLRGFRAA